MDDSPVAGLVAALAGGTFAYIGFMELLVPAWQNVMMTTTLGRKNRFHDDDDDHHHHHCYSCPVWVVPALVVTLGIVLVVILSD